MHDRTSFRAVLIAIGTELTEGQITNRNSASLGASLSLLGIEVIRHETVPDDRAAILAALARAEGEADFIFATGGLGPTSDDFTREIAAEWLGERLVYREASWSKIVRRLRSRGVVVAESNRRQCDFPVGVEILENPEGTADAFLAEKSTGPARTRPVRAYFLPGPPREIAAIWRERIAPVLRALPGLDPKLLYRWKCLGESESRLGEIVENALLPYTFERGYRASPPYVEVKVWVRASEGDGPEAKAARDALDLALRPYCVARDDEDLAERFLRTLADDEEASILTILDVGTDGALSRRLLTALEALATPDRGGETDRRVLALPSRLELLTRFPYARPNGNRSPASEITGEPAGPARFEDLELPTENPDPIFAIFPGGRAYYLHREVKESFSIESPYRSIHLRERENSYFAERALAFFRGAYERRTR